MQHRRAMARLAAALIGLSLLVAADDGDVLHDEDVVRMHVSGTPAEELIRLIRERQVDFDISDEMRNELRLAGVPQPVIAAMVARQKELDAAKAPPPLEEPPGLPRLTIRLNPDPDAKDAERPPLRHPDRVPPAVAQDLGLGDEARVTNLAILLACRTPDHVPDHWRSKSPVGRDFLSMPRHRLLAFVAGAEPGKADESDDEEQQILELRVPETIEVDLEPGVPHDLTLGVAVEIEGRYYLAVADEWDGLILEGSRDLSAEVMGKPRRQRIEVHFLKKS